MAKDLPYFKFSVSEWNDGDITICSMEAQGLFINLCSLYWSKEGRLSLTNVKRRFNGCNTTVWTELITERVIKIDGDDDIRINFLDEQLADRQKLSETNSKNVSKRWKNKHSDTVVLPSNNDRKEVVYNIEKKREEKKREEETAGDFYKTPADAFEEIKSDEIMVERLVRTVHNSGFKAATALQVMTAVKHFLTKESAKPEFQYRPRSAIKSHLVNWIAQNAKKLSDYG